MADLALVAGQAVVDEANLTGESMPVHKVSMTHEPHAAQGSRAESLPVQMARSKHHAPLYV